MAMGDRYRHRDNTGAEHSPPMHVETEEGEMVWINPRWVAEIRCIDPRRMTYLVTYHWGETITLSPETNPQPLMEEVAELGGL